MPISSELDKSKDLTIFTCRGQTGFKEQIAVLKTYYEGGPTKNSLWDMRGITGERISSEELRQIILFTKGHESKRPGGKCALVTTTDLDFGLGRMSDALGEAERLPWKIRAFRSMDEALAWVEE